MMERQGNEVILEGTLNHVMESRTALRWVVLEKNLELGHVYLSIYRKAPATKSDLKKRYELTDSNFIGTERGTIKTHHEKRSMLYWAIILKQESILFNDREALAKSTSQFEKWNEVVKKLWNHQSWEVSPLKGSTIENHAKLVLHLNTSSLCLALLSPPRHLLRWPLTSINNCDCHDCLFSFNVIGKDAPGYYEVKVTRSKHASKIKMVCNELRQVYNGENREPSIPSIPEFCTVPAEDSRMESTPAARDPLALHHYNRNTSICSTHSLNPERDTASVASFDSAMSTPSPTLKGDNFVITKNPFVFPPDGAVDESLRDAPCDTVISPAISHSPINKPVSKPRTPSPSSPYHVVCVDPHTHSRHVSSISTYPHHLGPLSPTTLDHHMPSSAQERNPLGSRLPKRTPDEGFCEERDSKQKGEASNEATYMNTYDDTNAVNFETQPEEPNNYMNFDDKSHYENPIPKKTHLKDNIGPKLAPKPQPPSLPPRKRELHQLIELAKMGKPLVRNIIQSYSAWKRFCHLFDIKKNSYPLKDWRALAERVGLKSCDIDMVDNTSCQTGKCTSTEIVLAYWQSNAPDDMPFTQDQLVNELYMMDRHDLVTILQQGEEHT